MTKVFSMLAVDDHQPNLMAVRMILQDLGAVVCVSSGEEALRRLLEHDFDLILLDILMPTMDGIETATLIRQRDRTYETPILFMTALEDFEQRLSEVQALNDTDCITKPFTSEKLRTKVESMLRLPPTL